VSGAARRRSWLALGALLAATFLLPAAERAVADGVPPVTMQLREQESGRFLAEWRVPQQLPLSAIPTPVLPPSSHPVGERDLTERPGAWFLRQVFDCPGGLAGRQVGVEFPMLNAMVSTILRVELLSGERYAHSFAPAEGPWRVPDAAAIGVRALYREARGATLAGVAHFLRGGLHWGLLLVLVLLARGVAAAQYAGTFALAQLGAALAAKVTGIGLPAALAEVGLATAVALLAREGLRPASEGRHLATLPACAGIVHGLGLAALVPAPAEMTGPALLFPVLVTVGMDAALIVSIGVVEALRMVFRRSLPAWTRTTLSYAAGVGAVALALAAPTGGALTGPGAAGLRLPDLPIPAGTAAAPGTTRIAAQVPDLPIQCFLSVAAFEVRVEVLVRLRDLAGELEMDDDAVVELDRIEAVKERLGDLLAARHALEVDASPVDPDLVRVDFLTLDDRGALPRAEPVVEQIAHAWMGATSVYSTAGTPGALGFTWTDFAGVGAVPVTLVDPETTRGVALTPEQPTLRWVNELSEDPTPVVTGLARERPVAPLPLLSLVLLALSIPAGAALARRGLGSLVGPLARATLAAVLLLAPIGVVALPLPSTWRTVPDGREAQRILGGLLPNVYRAFEFPSESAVYDRLALSVTGDTLAEVYLEHRRAVELEERGGARARVEAVEVLEVDSVEGAEAQGFAADAVWTVGGTVTHFGHRHYRRNRYDARVTVVPEGRVWKIHTIEVLDEERLE
jgi:hypothetical protein